MPRGTTQQPEADLTLGDVMRLTGLSRPTVSRLLNTRKIRGWRTSTGKKAHWRIPPKALEEFREAQAKAQAGR